MSILGTTDIGRGRYYHTLDHDPSVVATDGLRTSCAWNISDDTYWLKTDDGETTNWVNLRDAFNLNTSNTFTGILSGITNAGDALDVIDGLNVRTCETISTTTDSWTTVVTYTMTDDTVMHMTADVVGRRTDSADRAGYSRRGIFYREGGAGAMQQGVTDTYFTEESSGPWNCRLNVSGNDVLVQVKGGVGETINWKACYRVTEVS
jgi:hypothetical protein